MPNDSHAVDKGFRLGIFSKQKSKLPSFPLARQLLLVHPTIYDSMLYRRPTEGKEVGKMYSNGNVHIGSLVNVTCNLRSLPLRREKNTRPKVGAPPVVQQRVPSGHPSTQIREICLVEARSRSEESKDCSIAAGAPLHPRSLKPNHRKSDPETIVQLMSNQTLPFTTVFLP